MNRFDYFKITFLSISAGLFVGTMVYGLFDLDFSKKEALIQLFLKALFTATCTGFILGILNMFFKLKPFTTSKA
jgi:hypothetical protein